MLLAERALQVGETEKLLNVSFLSLRSLSPAGAFLLLSHAQILRDHPFRFRVKCLMEEVKVAAFPAVAQ